MQRLISKQPQRRKKLQPSGCKEPESPNSKQEKKGNGSKTIGNYLIDPAHTWGDNSRDVKHWRDIIGLLRERKRQGNFRSTYMSTLKLGHKFPGILETQCRLQKRYIRKWPETRSAQIKGRDRGKGKPVT